MGSLNTDGTNQSQQHVSGAFLVGKAQHRPARDSKGVLWEAGGDCQWGQHCL